MQNNTAKQPHCYEKPTIKAYPIATIRRALGPAVGFSTGRSDSEDSLLFEE